MSGAFGFVGTNLSAWLASRGHRVLALDLAARSPSAYAEFHTWDQLEAFDWNCVDAVVHLAGKAHDTRHADPQAYFDINLGLTQRIFERFRASQARTFIQFSSVKAATDAVTDGPLVSNCVSWLRSTRINSVECATVVARCAGGACHARRGGDGERRGKPRLRRAAASDATSLALPTTTARALSVTKEG